ncbi:unnamed protein product [Amoebophrya sp. A120]|nr:unnamed protein product [Amoebophrya sp. A120]|eukprot:GSA120T00020746001.1
MIENFAAPGGHYTYTMVGTLLQLAAVASCGLVAAMEVQKNDGGQKNLLKRGRGGGGTGQTQAQHITSDGPDQEGLVDDDHTVFEHATASALDDPPLDDEGPALNTTTAATYGFLQKREETPLSTLAQSGKKWAQAGAKNLAQGAGRWVQKNKGLATAIGAAATVGFAGIAAARRRQRKRRAAARAREAGAAGAERGGTLGGATPDPAYVEERSTKLQRAENLANSLMTTGEGPQEVLDHAVREGRQEAGAELEKRLQNVREAESPKQFFDRLSEFCSAAAKLAGMIPASAWGNRQWEATTKTEIGSLRLDALSASMRFG